MVRSWIVPLRNTGRFGSAGWLTYLIGGAGGAVLYALHPATPSSAAARGMSERLTHRLVILRDSMVSTSRCYRTNAAQGMSRASHRFRSAVSFDLLPRWWPAAWRSLGVHFR